MIFYGVADTGGIDGGYLFMGLILTPVAAWIWVRYQIDFLRDPVSAKPLSPESQASRLSDHVKGLLFIAILLVPLLGLMIWAFIR